jgi:glycosyltransferase involved in cell wall biosynthesis
MRVLLLIRELSHGGAERQLVELALGLSRRSVDVSVAVFYSHPDSDPQRRLAAGHVPLIDLDKRGRRDFARFAVKLARLLAHERPPIVYAFLPLANLASLVARLASPRSAIVWGVRCSDFEAAHITHLERALVACEALLSRVPDLVISNSRRGALDARARGFPSLSVVPNGIDTARFSPDPQRSRALRALWRIPADVPLIGTLGKLNHMKDFVTFARAAAIFVGRRDARFVWVGDATDAARLELESVAPGLVAWYPPRADVEVVHRAFDLFTLSSAFGEGFPSVVAEAMACGTPCVVTDTGDAADIVGDTGIVVPPRSPERLAEAWDELLSRRAHLAPARRMRTRQRILERYSLGALIDDTYQLLQALTTRQGVIWRRGALGEGSGT